MGMKFRMGCFLSMGVTEFNFCGIFIPKFSKTVWRSTAEYFFTRWWRQWYYYY